MEGLSRKGLNTLMMEGCSAIREKAPILCNENKGHTDAV
jgi:hypothetical protein